MLKARQFSQQVQNKFSLGQILSGFQVKQIERIKDIDTTAIRLKHVKTGADYLHLQRNDNNNLFSVGFKTVPHDSTGVAHILEHTVLCGSEKYPVRDPFFKMLNRSLSTFMNAMTGFDYTIYPFSSQNKKDFSNLMSVYLDAVFFPKIDRRDFHQEGWRLENEIVGDNKSPIVFKGIVFNEMKGALSESNDLFYTRMHQHLMKGTTYEHCSGGDPENITDLTYSDLKRFHQTFYHPSNSRFLTYGNFDLEDHLSQVNRILERFDNKAPVNDVGTVERFKEPKTVVMTSPIDPMVDESKQTKMCLSFLTNPISDTFETFCMRILGSLFTETQTSPMYEALIQSQLGTNFTAGTGYSVHSRETTFSVGATGLSGEEDVKKCEEVIMSTFEKYSQTGFPMEEIESKLHKIELTYKTQQSNYGLEIVFGMYPFWNHDVDPISCLQIPQFIARLREKLKTEKVFEELIKKHFLSNKHRLKFISTPDKNYNEKLASKEKEKLQKIIDNLTEQDKKVILEDGLSLQSYQNQPQETSLLPILQVEDIPKELNIKTTGKYEAIQERNIFWNEQPTNGITNIDVLAKFQLPEHLRKYLRLYCMAITFLGTQKRDRIKYSQDSEKYTGGIQAAPFIHSNLDDFEQGILVSSYALSKNTMEMLQLISETITEPSFDDQETLKALVSMFSSEMSNTIASSGFRFARIFSSSTFGESFRLRELDNGFSQMKLVQDIEQNHKYEEVIQKFKEISEYLRKGCSIRVASTSTSSGLEQVQKHINSFVSSLPNNISIEREKDISRDERMNSHISFSLPVNHISRCFMTVPYTHQDYPKLHVLSKFLSHQYLHREIREKNGAYGGGASFQGGVFNFYSYRDPSSLNTLQTFTNSVDWLINQSKIDQQQILESKLSCFSEIDRPPSPGNAGLDHFLHSITDEMKIKLREGLLSVERKDLIEACEKYLSDDKKSSTTIIGAECQNLTQENGWKIFK